MSEFAAFIGFDWADKKHDLCLVDAATGKKEFSIIKHTPQALEEWARALLSRFGGRKVAVCLEQSRAKDDPSDAEYGVELLIHHRERLKVCRPDDVKTSTLPYLVEHRRRVVSDQTRISNCMTALLKLYFPQVLEWFDDIRTYLVCDFLLRWPALDEVKKARATTLERFFREHNSVRKEGNQQRISPIKEAVALTHDRAVIDS